MTEESLFDNIRPYRDYEISLVISGLLESGYLEPLLKAIFPTTPYEVLKQQLAGITTIKEFQSTIIYAVLKSILKASVTQFSYAGLEKLDKNTPWLFISNHRDIVLDPGLTNFALHENGFETAEVAIGDNLLKEKWIEDLAKMNKSFMVRRNLQGRELVMAARTLSDYIRHTIVDRKTSVWIAQREGRAKDGNDRTQPGLVNMLGMASKSTTLKEHYVALNIVPMAVSYEIDPCDIEKIRAIYVQRFGGGYQKQPGEDHEAMRKGILGNKGKLHIQFGNPIGQQIESLPDSLHKNDLHDAICELVDFEIIEGYKLNATNYMAYDLFMQKTPDFTKYSQEDLELFKSTAMSKAESIEGDKHEILKIIYEISANPLNNKLAQKEGPLQSFLADKSNKA